VQRPHVLIVDDDPAIIKFVRANLEAEDYQTFSAMDGAEALQVIEKELPDLVILDIMMPRMDGFEVCRQLREWSQIPIIMLSARGDEDDKVTCLEIGADDYLTKPFDVHELVMRVRALLRRASSVGMGTEPTELTVGEMRLDRRKFTITTPEKTVLLTPVEFDLLSYLMGRPGQVFSPAKLLQTVWGYPPGTGSSDLVRVHIKNIREKIEPDPSSPRYVCTVPRYGYTVGE